VPLKPEYIPTPEEIEDMTGEIRAGWSEKDRLRRLGLPPKPTPLTVPIVKFFVSHIDGLIIERIE